MQAHQRTKAAANWRTKSCKSAVEETAGGDQWISVKSMPLEDIEQPIALVYSRSSKLEMDDIKLIATSSNYTVNISVTLRKSADKIHSAISKECHEVSSDDGDRHMLSDEISSNSR
ncbi:Os04g0481650 [Oryza sativa Japonica Group]|uniref:Os04g0481650 protein n=1 Tax=Oryza sativa subsp. japonica TaxID=39947 RepID=A0A0P0WBJ9_ORYSJ|nr:Os04g0481650 [Oryza sativa Japonica Group]